VSDMREFVTMTMTEVLRLTQYARGGGDACKVPPGELDRLLTSLRLDSPPGTGLLVGLAHGDDAAVALTGQGTAVVSTADFSNPVVDSPYDWGRIAAANALSDVYAMGGTQLVAVNLLAWPRAILPMELAAEVLRGGQDAAARAGCQVGGGHSVEDSEPKYGMAVTGIANPNRLLRIDAARPGVPLTLTKPLGTGVLNTHHKATGEPFPHAVEAMAQLNAEASRAALGAGAVCATDVTGFGLLGHLHKLAQASDVTAVIDAASVGYLAHARESLAAGYVSGGTRANLDWVRPWLDAGTAPESELLLLADAQISGGLLVAGEVPGYPVIGELTWRRPDGVTLVIR
jgi:selenide,water dikinase